MTPVITDLTDAEPARSVRTRPHGILDLRHQTKESA